jgi:hypothetical protein
VALADEQPHEESHVEIARTRRLSHASPVNVGCFTARYHVKPR